jgi:hypothetical protein
MRRWIWIILISLLLGMILNVAATWTIVVRKIGTEGLTYVHSTAQAKASWAVSVPADWPAESTQTDVMRWSSFESHRQLAARADGASLSFYDVERRSFGWPMLSMSLYLGTRIDAVPNGPQSKTVINLPSLTIGAGWVLRDRRDMQDVLPLVPRPLGFAVNSAFYGLLVFAMIAVFVFVFRPFRRAAWRAKGLCGGCGYEIGDLMVCPECGAGRP